MSRMAVLVVLALIGIMVPVAAAGATGSTVTIMSCGQVITTDAVLRTDLVCSGDAFTIGASHVTVRLGSHRITSSDGTGVGAGLGTLSDCASARGIPTKGGTVSDNRFLDNSGTGLVLSSGTWHVGSNTALRNGGLGIDAEGTALTVIDDGGNVARHNQPPQCIGVVCSA